MRTTGNTPGWRRVLRGGLTLAAAGALCLTLMAQGEGTVYQATTTHNCKTSLKTIRKVTASWAPDGTLTSLSTNKSGAKTEVQKITVEQNDKKLALDQGGETGGDYVATVFGAQPADGANVTIDYFPGGECGFSAKPKEEKK